MMVVTHEMIRSRRLYRVFFMDQGIIYEGL